MIELIMLLTLEHNASIKGTLEEHKATFAGRINGQILI